MTNALRDDEAEKAPFYVGVVAWVLRENPGATDVRVVSSAVKNLSYLELYSFILEGNSQNAKPIYEPTIDSVVLWNRLVNAGLSTGGVRMKANSTKFGDVLIHHCKLGTLEPPKN